MSSGSKSISQKSNSPPPRRKRSRSQERRRSPGYHRRGQNIPESNKLFVTNIDAQYSADDVKKSLEESFGTYGKIKDIIVKTKAGSSNSYAFIEFNQVQSSVKAYQNLKGMNFKGKELKVQYGKGQKKNSQKQLCYQCNRYGHYAKECRDKPRYDRDRDRDRDQGRSGRDRYYNRNRDDDDRHHRHYDYKQRSRNRPQRQRRSRSPRHKKRDSSSESYRKRSRSYEKPPRREREHKEDRWREDTRRNNF